MAIFMPVIRDADYTVRASGLSNVAELCEVLGFGLLPHIEEIMETIYQILIVEKNEEVRRGIQAHIKHNCYNLSYPPFCHQVP